MSTNPGRTCAARLGSHGKSQRFGSSVSFSGRMNDSDPTWLRGALWSECSVLRWREENHRQFCVLPFYEGNRVEQSRERYLLWGRALSDGKFYPIPTWWYALDLVPDLREGVSWYQWVCQVSNFSPTPIRMELNGQAPLDHPNREVRALKVDEDTDILTPEPVQGSKGTADRPFTIFYPDTSLWSDSRCEVSRRLGGRQEPVHISERPLEGYYARAQAEICARSSHWQVLGLRSVSTNLWSRTDVGL